MQFLEEHINRMLLPRLGYPDLTVEFDRSDIEALKEDEAARVSRESQMLDRGVLTIKNVATQPPHCWIASPLCSTRVLAGVAEE